MCEPMAFQYGSHQLINELSHVLENLSSDIDLIFTTQLNLVMESDVHSSLRGNCHYQFACAKFNFNIYYTPPYEQIVLLDK